LYSQRWSLAEVEEGLVNRSSDVVHVEHACAEVEVVVVAVRQQQQAVRPRDVQLRRLLRLPRVTRVRANIEAG